MSHSSELLTALGTLLQNHSATALSVAAKEMSDRYRESGLTRVAPQGDAFFLAYAATRMPATYAVLTWVLEELKHRVPTLQPKRAIDLGAGPGTTAWALASCFESLEQTSLFEREKGFIQLGQKLLPDASLPALQNTKWHHADLKQTKALDASDLIVASYALGELNQNVRQQLLQAAAQATSTLVLLEPGTTRGYQIIIEARQQLIDLGFQIAAPCPHEAACPMSGNDWCHFSKRFLRSSFHRAIKGAQLGYEDEKFSYLIATRLPFERYSARLVKRPRARPGHVILDLCTPEGLKREVVAKSNKARFARARKVEWGETWSATGERAED